MPALREHEKIGSEFLAGIQNKPTMSYELPFPRKMVWAALLDGPAWGEWLGGLEVEWTSPEPFKEGTTRTVRFSGQTVNEYFFGWEEGKRMSFCFTESTLPVRALLEDYNIIDTEKGCRLEWTLGLKAMFPLTLLVRWQMKRGFRQGFPKLEALLRDNPKRFGG